MGCSVEDLRALLSQAAPRSRLTRANETTGAAMKVFVAGATGAIGRQLVPQLVARGHDVVGMTRSAAKQDLVRSLGARPVVADPLDPDDAPAALRSGQAAIRHREQAVTTIEWGEGLALRYGAFYGPGTGISAAPDALMAAPIRKRRFPIVGDGGGVYNVVDDEPAPVREWLPVLASALDAKPPRRVPRWLARLAAGEVATVMMTEVRGASNAKAKRELGWTPRYPSWRGVLA